MPIFPRIARNIPNYQKMPLRNTYLYAILPMIPKTPYGSVLSPKGSALPHQKHPWCSRTQALRPMPPM